MRNNANILSTYDIVCWIYKDIFLDERKIPKLKDKNTKLGLEIFFGFSHNLVLTRKSTDAFFQLVAYIQLDDGRVCQFLSEKQQTFEIKYSWAWERHCSIALYSKNNSYSQAVAVKQLLLKKY